MKNLPIAGIYQTHKLNLTYFYKFDKQIQQYLYIESLWAWVPLKGFGQRERPTRMCGLDLWLKPFKGGYSKTWRVVN
jgi:hypothetical protein